MHYISCIYRVSGKRNPGHTRDQLLQTKKINKIHKHIYSTFGLITTCADVLVLCRQVLTTAQVPTK